MKLFVVVALFAFVALQSSQAAPAEDVKKEEPAPVVTTPTATTSELPASAAPVAEVKVESVSSSSDVATSPAADTPAPAPVQEKKP